MRALPSSATILCALQPLPSVGPAASTPHRIRWFARHPPETTIAGTAHSSSPDACSSRAAPLAGAAHPLCVQRLLSFPIVPPSHSSLPGTPRPSSAGFRPHLSAPAPQCIPSQVYTTTGVPSARPGRSFSRACHSLPPRSLRRLRCHPTPSLHPPLSRNTTRSLSVVCQSPASPSSSTFLVGF
ncbi:hypothetical protein DFH08DRAFT_865766 [Mycena albidolilacea]|uniref:Uncharacterized protein n=1 Tax=Mycena albidolilacea TaxID=1033008 RepID=A0AAD7A3M5_9AGAR|nr:hypothetical protein DFH08DRAFT_865766 [Mycena albidolilacea]